MPADDQKNKGGRPAKHNWSAIRRDWECSHNSSGLIAETWGITRSQLCKKAREDGWARPADYPYWGGMETVAPIGAPARFTVAHREYLLEQIAYGRTLKSIMNEPGMPGLSVFYYHFKKDDGFRSAFFDAKEIAGLVIGDQILDVTDRMLLPSDDIGFLHHAPGKAVSDNLKWMASRLNRRLYGDKGQADESSSGGSMPSKIEVVGVDGGLFGEGDDEGRHEED